MASWDSKVSILCTIQNPAGSSRSSGYFFAYSFMSTVNLNILLLTHSVYSREVCNFKCSQCLECANLGPRLVVFKLVDHQDHQGPQRECYKTKQSKTKHYFWFILLSKHWSESIRSQLFYSHYFLLLNYFKLCSDEYNTNIYNICIFIHT